MKHRRTRDYQQTALGCSSGDVTALAPLDSSGRQIQGVADLAPLVGGKVFNCLVESHVEASSEALEVSMVLREATKNRRKCLDVAVLECRVGKYCPKDLGAGTKGINRQILGVDDGNSFVGHDLAGRGLVQASLRIDQRTLGVVDLRFQAQRGAEPQPRRRSVCSTLCAASLGLQRVPWHEGVVRACRLTAVHSRRQSQ